MKFQPKQINEIYDLVIVGGGLTGVAAAIAAAREGQKVLIVEKTGCLGGMATMGLVNPFMGYKERGSGKIVNDGIFGDILKILNKNGCFEKSDNPRAFKEQMLKILLDQMIEENHVSVLFHALMSDLKVRNKTIKSITISGVSGNIEIKGKYFMDATGDGNLFAFAGCDFFIGRDEDHLVQPMTTCCNISHVDMSKFDREKVFKLYGEYKEKGLIKNPRENVLAFSIPIDDICHLNTTRIIKKNPCDIVDLSESEIESRKQILEIYTFLKDNFDYFKDAEIVNIAETIGVRESRRLHGQYIMTEDDVLNTTKFEDSVARGTYDVDIHNPDGTGTVIKHIPDNDYYTIPYRSLLPLDIKNMIVAGRNISTTHEALSSVRIMPICCCMGEAAGYAAALANKNNQPFDKVDIKKLHELLDKYNCLY